MRLPARLSLSLLLILCLALANRTNPARADWVNLTGAEVAPNIAEMFVEDAGLRITLEIYVGDLEMFSDLIPADWFGDGRETLPDPQRLRRFSREGLVVRGDGAEPLPAQLVIIDPRLRVDRRSPFAGMIDPFSGRRLPEPPEDPRVLFVELFYPFVDGRPDTLTLSPPMTEDDIPSASIGMLVFHRDVPVIDFRYFTASATLTLDWDDPWYSRFDNPNLTRHHRYPRMSFLYAEPYEIRHEALLRVRDAGELVGLDPEGSQLTEEEAARLTSAAAETIAARSPMTIDGATVTPDFDRAAFMRIGARGLELLEPGAAIDVDAAILGLIWSVSTDGYPQQATVEWTLFDDRADQVPGYSIDAAGPFLSPLTPDDPQLVWTNHFKRPPVPPVEEIASKDWAEIRVPAFSIGLWILASVLVIATLRRGGWPRRAVAGVLAAASLAAGVIALPFGTIGLPRPGLLPATMTEEQATALTERLLTNVYRAFDFRGEAQVYDRLAKTVDGALLEEVYLDQRRTLRVARAGGAQARVQSVEIDFAEPTPVPGTAADFVVRARWRITGRVGHWGHVHQRANLYEAVFTISAGDGAWKITDFEVLEQERLS